MGEKRAYLKVSRVAAKASRRFGARRALSLALLLAMLCGGWPGRAQSAAPLDDLFRLFQVALPPADVALMLDAWTTIPLLEAGALSGDPQPPAQPSAADMIDDDQRTEAMQKFIDADDQVAAVREQLLALFNQQGREQMRRQIERYCREALEPAINSLAADSPLRHQLEVEQAELEEVAAELKSVMGLKLAR